MPPVVPQGGTFSFSGFSGLIVGLSVQERQAEIVDMSGWGDSNDQSIMVPTGVKTGGAISVDFIVSGTANLNNLIGKTGTLTFNSSGFAVSRQVICESGEIQATVGDAVRGTIKFAITDYYGQ